MGKTVNKGAGPFAIVGIVFLVMICLFVVLIIFKAVYPEGFEGIFGKPDDRLVKENQELKAQLNQTQAELGQAKGELAGYKREKAFWTVVIIFVLILIAALIVWMVILKQGRGLTIKEAIKIFGELAREQYGYPLGVYNMRVPTPRVIERVKHKGDPRDELMYAIEFHFVEQGEKNRYFHGSTPPKDNVITVVLLNKTWEYRQRWYPFLTIDEAFKTMHNEELWGFGLQKTKLEEDVLANIDDARSKDEIKDAFKDPDVEAQ
jgi:hypothetical protein